MQPNRRCLIGQFFMLISRDAFVHAAVNWEAKSGNLRNLATKLGLGLDSFLFLDDNPAEIAEVLGLPPGTVRSRIARGRAKLAALLDHLDDDPGNQRDDTDVRAPDTT